MVQIQTDANVEFERIKFGRGNGNGLQFFHTAWQDGGVEEFLQSGIADASLGGMLGSYHGLLLDVARKTYDDKLAQLVAFYR